MDSNANISVIPKFKCTPSDFSDKFFVVFSPWLVTRVEHRQRGEERVAIIGNRIPFTEFVLLD